MPEALAMAKIHVPGDGHTAPTGGTFRYLPYTDRGKKRVIEQALFILRHNVHGMRPCNDCFRALPGGRSFDDILDDPLVFIHYDPQTTAESYAATRRGTKNVTITQYSIGMGRWTVAATLVHEFAHINGAPSTTHQAEGTLKCCGFRALEDPRIIGSADPHSDVCNA
jgi:hypothetical protein